VVDACSNGRAASAGCASARLEAYSAKGEYETGNYNNKVSDMYPDAYGQILNLLNITSVDAPTAGEGCDGELCHGAVWY